MDVSSGTTDNSYADDMSYAEYSRGANPVRFIVSVVPIVLVLIKRKDVLTEKTPPIINLSINMTFVSSVLYLASVFTSGILVGRLPIYCELYCLILIPWIINRFDEADKRTVTIALYVLYFLYYCYQIFIAWGDIKFTVNIFGIEF